MGKTNGSVMALGAVLAWAGPEVAAQTPPATVQPHMGGEANLVLPDLSQVTFLGGIDGHTLLYSGLVVSCSACSSAW